MVSSRKLDFPSSVFIFVYLLSVLIIYFNQHFKWHTANYHTYSFFSINDYIAKSINIIFLLFNTFFIKTIFTNKDRNILGDFHSFVYVLVHNKVWFLNAINNYLINDFFILLTLYILNPKDQKQKMNLLIFYLACFFGLGFLIGINFVYSFLVPLFLFNLFLISDIKSWVIFFLGYLLPIYFFVSISWLLDYEPLLYLQVILENSFYNLSQFSFANFKFLVDFQWLKSFGVIILIVLIFITWLKEWTEVNFYSNFERRMALFFFIFMFVSLINYLLIHVFYHQQALSVIALPFAYHLGKLLNKINLRTKYFVIFLLFALTVFL